MSQPVVLDVETQLTFRDVGGYEPGKLKISVAGLYDYASDKYMAFEEERLVQLFPYLENASAIIGFNVVDFDLPALNPYYVGNLSKLPTLDLLKFVEKSLGFRLSLDDIAKETLGAKKTGHGLLAIEYFKAGEFEKLKAYCLSDVKLTKDLYEFGKREQKVFYKAPSGRREVQVDWGKVTTETTHAVNLTLPW